MRPSNASSSTSEFSVESAPVPTTLIEVRRERILSTVAKPPIRESRFCFNLTKWETFIYILGIFTLAAGVTKIVIIALKVNTIHKKLPEITDQEVYYFCGIGIIFSAIVILWEIPLLYFVRKRNLSGMKHWMFATLLHFMGSALAAVITGARYQGPGMFLSFAFLFDFLRAPAQMYFVHQFITIENLDDDSFYLTAIYKKF